MIFLFISVEPEIVDRVNADIWQRKTETSII